MRILVQMHKWAIFLRKWARRGRYKQWRSLSGHVERIIVHKNGRRGYWQHLVSTGRRYVPNSRRLLLCQPRQPFEWNYFPLLTGGIVLSNKKSNLRKYSVVFFFKVFSKKKVISRTVYRRVPFPEYARHKYSTKNNMLSHLVYLILWAKYYYLFLGRFFTERLENSIDLFPDSNIYCTGLQSIL